MKHLLSVRSHVAGLATWLVAASLMGCMEFMEMASTDGRPPSDGPASSAAPRRYETTSVTVRVAGPLTVASAKGTHADIATVTVTVAGENSDGVHQDALATANLGQSPDGIWTGTLSGLTVGTELTFTAEARDSNGAVIFEGTHSVTLDGVGAQITIRLNAVDDDGSQSVSQGHRDQHQQRLHRRSGRREHHRAGLGLGTAHLRIRRRHVRSTLWRLSPLDPARGPSPPPTSRRASSGGTPRGSR